MSAEEDKYPLDSDRRRFVKGVVGAAALGGLGSTGVAAIDAATPPTGAGGGLVQFMGIDRVSGPAPRGMPQIPILVDEDGTIRGRWPEVREEEVEGRTVLRAEEELGGVTYSAEWFQYCGVQTSPAIDPGEERDDVLRSAPTTQYEWQNEALEPGEPLDIAHFEDYAEWGNEIGQAGLGKPALAAWRSEGLGPDDRLVVQLIRSPIIEALAEEDEWLAASTDRGVIAYLNVCTPSVGSRATRRTGPRSVPAPRMARSASVTSRSTTRSPSPHRGSSRCRVRRTIVAFETVFTSIARCPAIYRVETFKRYYSATVRRVPWDVGNGSDRGFAGRTGVPWVLRSPLATNRV